MGGTVCFTSFTFDYLARARVLAQTLKSAHPDWELWALVSDAPPPGLDEDWAFAPFDQFLYAAALEIPRFPAWLFKHDLVEACTAVKAPMLQFLLARGAERVVYLDPDIAIFAPLDFVENRLQTGSIILTPHQSDGNAETLAIRDNEMTSLQYGIFNLGFLAVRNDASGRAFAQWWTGMTRAACYDDVQNGIFTDQKYCDLVPGLFDGVQIERDAGANLASWNLSRRHLRFETDGRLTVNGTALKFYHFTKIDDVGAVMTERAAQDNMAVYEVVNWYKRAVAQTILPEVKFTWHYATFDNGDAIPRAVRLAWRMREDLWTQYENPFATGAGSFHDVLTRIEPNLLGAGQGVL